MALLKRAVELARPFEEAVRESTKWDATWVRFGRKCRELVWRGGPARASALAELAWARSEAERLVSELARGEGRRERERLRRACVAAAARIRERWPRLQTSAADKSGRAEAAWHWWLAARVRRWRWRAATRAAADVDGREVLREYSELGGELASAAMGRSELVWAQMPAQEWADDERMLVERERAALRAWRRIGARRLLAVARRARAGERAVAAKRRRSEGWQHLSQGRGLGGEDLSPIRQHIEVEIDRRGRGGAARRRRQRAMPDRRQRVRPGFSNIDEVLDVAKHGQQGRGKHALVSWEGEDPVTGEPWPHDWLAWPLLNAEARRQAEEMYARRYGKRRRTSGEEWRPRPEGSRRCARLAARGLAAGARTEAHSDDEGREEGTSGEESEVESGEEDEGGGAAGGYDDGGSGDGGGDAGNARADGGRAGVAGAAGGDDGNGSSASGDAPGRGGMRADAGARADETLGDGGGGDTNGLSEKARGKRKASSSTHSTALRCGERWARGEGMRDKGDAAAAERPRRAAAAEHTASHAHWGSSRGGVDPRAGTSRKRARGGGIGRGGAGWRGGVGCSRGGGSSYSWETDGDESE